MGSIYFSMPDYYFWCWILWIYFFSFESVSAFIINNDQTMLHKHCNMLTLSSFIIVCTEKENFWRLRLKKNKIKEKQKIELAYLKWRRNDNFKEINLDHCWWYFCWQICRQIIRHSIKTHYFNEHVHNKISMANIK